MQLAPNFTLAEMTASDTARRRGIDNTPTEAELANLRRLAETLQLIRDHLGHPVIITSGFRNEALNRAVGGVPNSAHRRGLAADFTCPRFGTTLQTCRAIDEAGIAFDQLILEYKASGSWIHLGLAPAGNKPRRQRLTEYVGQGTIHGFHGPK